MTLRTRVGVAAGLVVLLALALASVAVYSTVRDNLRRQVDTSLADVVPQTPAIAIRLKQDVIESKDTLSFETPIDLGSTLLQLVIVPEDPRPGRQFIPVTDRDLAVLRGTEPPYYQDAVHEGVAYRVYTAPMPETTITLVRVARPLSAESDVLRPLAVLLVALTAVGGAIAALAGRLMARRVLRPVRVLTDAVEHVTATQDLSSRVDLTGSDEIGRLGRSFATMMTALDISVQAQRQLVADASHELRTPLTSLTTNLELLADGEGLGDPEAPVMVREAIRQAGELRTLVNDLIDLARYGEGTARAEDTRLDLVAARVVAKAAARSAGVRFESALSPCLVHVDPDGIERAVGNLVDNAVKWSPPGGRVLVTVADGELAVTDEGPGIPAADLPFVFDRFYRSAQARSLPGSGLGLAIVRQVVETHGGQVAAESLTPGTRMRLRLPVLRD
ncbi:sensor histidine kinase [Saccharothrix coeruleofusca]|uniref:histidine kinase n=1 Tax=Saccharothrix coeruleofusca TaxID=33919 RepID=A0A918ASA0_9PSEU|nr:HAMP domain-containing sensor histidine kinase [Saccharothrix coeruleofusca]MBP2335900.1 two-component system sensor histidine kinase MprB [Saccharothrix coeruleofusca]GGP76765.1 two-component sensor histidine kinase [Saccharothrix coeruleofusca]